MKKTIASTILMLLPAFVFAASGSHDDHSIPFGKIGIQALNLGILLVGIFFFVKASIVDAFKARQKDYQEQSEKTAQALVRAEAELKEIKEKLKNLENSATSSLDSARKESEALKTKIVAEAEQQAVKIKNDVAVTIGAEVYKAKNEIRKEIIEASLAEARKSIEASAESITKKSEKGFISDLGQVRA